MGLSMNLFFINCVKSFFKNSISLLREINKDIKELFSLTSDGDNEEISLHELFIVALMAEDTLKEIATNCVKNLAKTENRQPT